MNFIGIDPELPSFISHPDSFDQLSGGGGGGALNFFQVGVCGPDFRSVGLVN